MRKNTFTLKLWSVWCRTMGERISSNDVEADVAAIIRTFWWITHIITCFFIISGVVRHWNN